jgi:hypothetical protein
LQFAPHEDETHQRFKTLGRKAMMKNIFALVALTLISGATFANTKSVAVSLANREATVQLSDEVGHHESETYLVQRTCSRDVVAGYHRECRVVTDENCEVVQNRDCQIVNGERVCRDNPTRVCHPVDHRECWDVADYRREYYDCSYYATRTWYVKDYDTTAAVRVILDNIAPNLDVKESLDVKLDGSTVSVASSSKTSKAILLAEIETQGSETVTSTVHLTALPTADVTAPLAGLKVADVNDDTGEVKVEVAGLNEPELFALKVSLKDPEFLAKDIVLAEGKLVVKDLPATKSGSKTTLLVNLKDIGVDIAALKKGKYKVEVELKSLLNEGAIVNRQSLPSSLNSEASGKLKKK